MHQADHMSKPGAEQLARQIKQYWFDRGVKVNAWAERSHGEGEGEIWVVRSDQKNIIPAAATALE